MISVDTKKKELVGDFRKNGREYRPQGRPEEVRVQDLLIKELGRSAPYGVYDLAANAGRVSVGVNHDTAAFAVNIISQWWRNLATSLPQRDPAADDRRWRRQQWLAGQAVEARVAEAGQRTRPRRRGQPLAARHQQVEQNRAPPLSFISQNWRAQPPVSYPVIVELISATTTKTGLTVRCELDTSQYPRGIVVSDAEITDLNIKPAEFHGEWNCTISSNFCPSNCAFIS